MTEDLMTAGADHKKVRTPMNYLKEMLAKTGYIFKEVFFLIGKHKVYFLAPLFIVLALLAFLIYYIGPTIMVSFIYAGV